MEKVCSVANPLNDGQEPIELTPEDCQKMSPNDYAPEFNCKMDVQQEATQLMLENNLQEVFDNFAHLAFVSLKAEVNAPPFILKVVEEIPVPISWKEIILQWVYIKSNNKTINLKTEVKNR